VKAVGNITAGQNQLRWVVLLLAIAVILPTVCLLWFMSHAVKNERLAVRQKLTDVYQQRLDRLSQKMDNLWSDRIQSLGTKGAGFKIAKMFSLNLCDAMIVYDNNDKLVYPLVGNGAYQDKLPEEFNKAWHAEFIEEDFAGASELYDQIAGTSEEDYIRYSALMGKVRCLRKSGDIKKAIDQCNELAYGQTSESMSSSSVSLMTRARVLLIELKSQTEDGLGESDVRRLIDSAVNYTPGTSSDFLPMPLETRVFFLRKAIDIVENSQWADLLQAEVLKAKELLSAEELAMAFLGKYGSEEVTESWSEDNALKLVSSLRVLLDTFEEIEWNYTDYAERLKQQISIVLDSYASSRAKVQTSVSEQSALAKMLESWPEDSFRKLDLPETVFGVHHTIGDRTYILLQTAEALTSDFDLCADGLEDPGVSYRIMDGSGTCVTDSNSLSEEAFLHAPLGQFFPGWNMEVHFDDVDIFERTANRQRVIYVWTGLLAIAAMMAAGVLTAQAVGKQIKINKLKNDFIATVSHELKTPLASMRVLVDTLLEGSYRDQRQVTDYLQLISKENERLSGLIDNFLTFSRMERNKQAFVMARTSPAAIVNAAVEAVKTKFTAGRCAFKVDITENLPDVMADRDAMVTVLVNLLDNAYKYSYDDKRIELRAFTEDGSVCFRVCDNGQGMSRRALKKIFARFYQVDRSLSRRAEGCGLGLSIAKFIVDAHKGTITVDSRFGEGSIFTVRLSACN
jgi:signal transduction histidine kinase